MRRFNGYGLYNPPHPSDIYPDEECCTKEEIERWKRDCEREKQGNHDYERGWGMGMYYFEMQEEG